MNTKIYNGYLKLGSNGEENDILFLEGHDYPVAEELCDEIANKFVFIRYYVSNIKITLEQAEEYFIRQLYGEIEVNYEMRYSEITGYLWTDEELKVGGHDLLEEFKTYIGKYLILIAEIDEDKEREKENKRMWDNAKSNLRNLDYWAKDLGLSRKELIEELDYKLNTK